MAERLTYWNNKEKKSALPKCINDFGDVVDLEDLCYKLACLEDILEKYGLEVEELDVTLKIKTNSIKGFEKLKQDRDTWKMACELACKYLEVTPFNEKNDKYVEYLVNYYYQKAKNKGDNDERN